MKARARLLFDRRFLEHKPGWGHVERPERLTAIHKALKSSGLSYEEIEARHSDFKWIEAVHSRSYIDRFRKACERNSPFIDYSDGGDSPISRDSFDTAALAAESVVSAVDLIMSREAERAFLALRPPGHHAGRNSHMGFCFFNNAAVGANYLIENYGLERVLILDWDVHHGNGTQDIFYKEPRVYFCSLHGDPRYLYPGTGFAEETGEGKAKGTTLNIPLAPGTGDEEYREAFMSRFLPWARKAKPQFIIVSAGFDAHRMDPLGNLNLSSEFYRVLTEETLVLAGDFAGGRLISLLEGGYNLQALGESATFHLEALCRT